LYCGLAQWAIDWASPQAVVLAGGRLPINTVLSGRSKDKVIITRF
jgi:hypothetical protein